MQLIGKQAQLIEALVNELSITSSRIINIHIYTNNDLLQIDIELEFIYKKGHNRGVLKFIDVQEYGFCYTSDRHFYNVEIFKFFKLEEDFYISFDPVDESETIHNEDQDFIKARQVEGFLIIE